jgi:N-acetylmuramoyl-L-alanine amidase
MRFPLHFYRADLYIAIILCLVTVKLAASPFATLQYDFEWRLLDRYQASLTRKTFDRHLDIMSPDGSMKEYLEYDGDRSVTVFDGKVDDDPVPVWTLTFARDEEEIEQHQPLSFDQDWLDSLIGRDRESERPLTGLTICLDPGHIGGEWANIEERYFRIGRYPPVKEGDLTRLTMELLAPQLEAAGATVVWTGRDSDPLTPIRPDNLEYEALHFMHDQRPDLFKTTGSRFLRALLWRQEFLFYRRAEIQARAEKIAELKPDFTICLHYNAAPWRYRPQLFKVNKLVIFVQGSYMKEELEEENQRYFLMKNILSGDIDRELEIGKYIGEAMEKTFAMPAENYLSSGYSHPVGDHPYLWSRNLIANRIFPGPVLFVEGPYMNDRDTFYRIQAGDYEGVKTIRGKEYRSLFREFADSVAEGIIAYGKATRESR